MSKCFTKQELEIINPGWTATPNGPEDDPEEEGSIAMRGYYIHGIDEVGEGGYVIREQIGTLGEIASGLSDMYPEGQWWVGTKQLTHQVGRKTAYFMVPERYGEMLKARSVYKSLTGYIPTTWGLMAICRSMLRWAVEPHSWGFGPEHEAFLRPPTWSYLRVRPGTIGNCRMIDIKSAYHQILFRLPSPCLRWNPRDAWNGLEYMRLSPTEKSRWTALLVATKEAKPLRLALHGAMCGSEAEPVIYREGRLFSGRRAKQGEYRGAGLLVVRTVYELCGLQAEDVDADYANTDCVSLRWNEEAGRYYRPAVWDRYGVSYGVMAEGETDIRGPGGYRCGHRETVPYEAMEGAVDGRSWDESRLPETILLGKWL